MPQKTAILLFFFIALFLLVGLGQPFFIIQEGEQAIITQFGMPMGGAIKDAGLHFKTPFIQNVTRLDKRILQWDGDPAKNVTKDKRNIWIALMARWRIQDPLKYLQTVNNELGAKTRLDDILESQTKSIVSSQPLIEIVRNSNRKLEIEVFDETEEFAGVKRVEEIQRGHAALTRDILDRSKAMIAQFGIELVDVRIKRINYTDEVKEKIYDRMIAERRRAAEKFRSEGQGRKAEIEGQREKELKRIESEAYLKAQEIRGKADAEATRIYADAFGKDPEFYSFTKAIDTYRSTVDEKTTLILSTESEYFKYLKKSSPPQPAQ